MHVRPPASSAAIARSMRGNRGRDTKPELLVRRLLREHGYAGYRVHWSKAPGKPDIAYPGRKVAVFVNGCYWHRCPRCSARPPKANSEFWRTKFEANEARDARNYAALDAMGWTVVVVWECDLRRSPVDAIAAVLDALRHSVR